MRGKMIGPIALICVFAFAQDFHGQVKYLPDYIGKAHRLVFRGPQMFEDRFGLSAAEIEALHHTMQQVADFLLAQPALNPPRGFMTKGDMQIIDSSLCPKGPCRDVPIPGWVHMIFYECWEQNGKPMCGGEYGNSVGIYINDPEALVLHNAFRASPDAFRDVTGPTVLLQPNRYGKIQGAALYGYAHGNDLCLVLTRSSKPLFLPLPQETYLSTLIQYWEKEEAKLVGDSQKKNPYASDDTYQEWLAGREERVKQSKGFCELLRKGGDPKVADECLRDAEKREEETGKNLKMMNETAKKSEAQVAVGMSKGLQDMRSLLARLKARQASMTPAERQAQAHWNEDLRSPDDPKGWPLAMVNPEIIDRSLPRTAVQIIEVFFESDVAWDPLENPHLEHADARGLYKLEQTSNWAALRELLAK